MKHLFLLPFMFAMLWGCSSNPTSNSIEPGSPSGIDRSSPRSEQEIGLIMHRYMGAITQLYQRARRENPALKGKVVFEITIEPSGVVVACNVLSSEMNAPDLLEKITDEIKAVNFGAKDMPSTTMSFPLEFIPHG